MPKVAAFVARSFLPADESKIAPITDFLDAFRSLGFTWESAEAAEPQLVSAKARQKIDDANVFVGILTKRHPIYDFTHRWRSAVELVTRRLVPVGWTAPAWVIQESGYARKGNKKLILLLEEGVELPGLQGDLEYIPFTTGDYALAFRRAGEMINRIISEASGTVVETTVRTEEAATSVEPKLAEAKAEAKTEAKAEGEPPVPASMGEIFFEMMRALADKDFKTAARLYAAGVELTKKQKPDSLVWWAALYHRHRYSAGDATALTELHELASHNPSDPAPPEFIGDCLSEFGEHESAAQSYMKSAELSDAEGAVDRRLDAVRSIRKIGTFLRAKEILVGTLNDPNLQIEAKRAAVLGELYAVLKELGETYNAFAVGEMALHENPVLGRFRFSIAYDYDEAGYPEMALRHYKLLLETEPANNTALNNAGVAYSKLDMPIMSSACYRKALEMGETLGASNLCYKYLDAGMADEAATLAKDAMQKHDPSTKLPEVLAAVERRRRDEAEKEKASVKLAGKHRDYMVPFSYALLDAALALIDGVWTFPFAKLALKVDGAELSGYGEETEEIPPSAFLTALGGSSEPSQETKKFTLSGSLQGRTCRFRIEVEVAGRGLTGGILGASDQTKEGYMTFSSAGDVADIVELKDDKPGKYYRATRS